MIFRNLWCVRTDKEGGDLSQCGQAGGGVSFFAILCEILHELPLSFYQFGKYAIKMAANGIRTLMPAPTRDVVWIFLCAL